MPSHVVDDMFLRLGEVFGAEIVGDEVVLPVGEVVFTTVELVDEHTGLFVGHVVLGEADWISVTEVEWDCVAHNHILCEDAIPRRFKMALRAA